MEVEQRAVGDVVVLSIRGDLTMDGTWATPLSDIVRSAVQDGHDRFVVDLGRVESAGQHRTWRARTFTCRRANEWRRDEAGARDQARRRSAPGDNLRMVFECFDRESEALASFDQSTIAHRSGS